MDNQENTEFCMKWFNELLHSMEENCTAAECSRLLKPCSNCHFKDLEPLFEKYVGNLQGFIEDMKKEWNQLITYDADNKIILVDENKDYCVCPITQSMEGQKVSPILCYCSANMNAAMISKITGKNTESRVVSSVLRGDPSCIYEIKIID